MKFEILGSRDKRSVAQVDELPQSENRCRDSTKGIV